MPLDNTAVNCLGEDPPSLFRAGSLGLFDIFPCVGVTAYPCDNENTLELATAASRGLLLMEKTAVIGRTDLFKRLDSSESGDAFLHPETVFVQVKDPAARIIDTQSASVNSGTAPSWQTARKPDSRSGDRTVGGVEISYTRRGFTSAQITNYSNLARTMAVTGLDGGTAPGLVKVRFPTTGNTFYDLTAGTVTKPTFALNSPSTTVIPYFAEFSTLGTYIIAFTAAATHTDGTVYSDTGNYTFHVGPVADLEVRGLEESSLATAEQMVYAIEAVNHGPDEALGAKVAVKLPGDATFVQAISPNAGSHDEATNTYTWNTGPLQRANHLRAVGLPEGETLTLIVTCETTCGEAEATISNDNDNHPYTVCIDSSGNDVLPKPANESACTTTAGNTWHEGTVYDYDTTNDEVDTLTAEKGTGAVTELIPETMTTGVVPGGSAETPEVDPDTGETHPVQVEVEVPAASTVATDDVVITASEISGYDGDSTAFVFDVTTMHTGTEADPLVLRFHITTDTAREDMDVYYTDDEGNLLRVPDCVGGALGTGEERCVSERQRVNDVVTVTVLTTNASEWRVVVPPIETKTETRIEYRDREVPTTITVTETVYESEDHYAYFADEETTRTVAENSAPGSPVGAPVTVIRNSGNKVVYSLEGPDAALFTIEQDTGQILVGKGALLDYESGTASYTVEVVADPRSGADVKTTVTISVTDVAETGFVFIDPAGAPLVGAPLFASLLHTEGEPVEPRWQWQRSMPDGAWADIPGAILEIYTPSDLDAGRRLRALVVFGNPLGDGEGLEGAVTERVPGEAQVIPTAGTGTAPEEVFGVLGHSLAVVWQFDNATQTWAVYSPWNAPELNDLKTVSRGDVVWMDIISEAQFQGNTLYPGWNLVILN